MARDRALELAERTADAALAAMPVPLRILDIGCGYGELLREFVARVPYCRAYVGLDEDAAAMLEARELTDAVGRLSLAGATVHAFLASR